MAKSCTAAANDFYCAEMLPNFMRTDSQLRSNAESSVDVGCLDKMGLSLLKQLTKFGYLLAFSIFFTNFRPKKGQNFGMYGSDIRDRKCIPVYY